MEKITTKKKITKKKTPLKRANKKRSATSRSQSNTPLAHGREAPDPNEVIDGIHARLSDTPRDGEPDSSDRNDYNQFFRPNGGLIYMKAVQAVTHALGSELLASRGLLEAYDARLGIYKEVAEADVHQVLKRELGDRLGPTHASGVLQMLRNEHAKPPEDIAPDKTTLCFQNGVVIPGESKLVPHSPKFRHRSRLPFAFDPKAECQLWEDKLEEIFDGNEGLIRLLECIFAYCLTHNTGFQVFFLFVGSGANGKGVILSTLRNLAGEDNVSAVPPEKFNVDFMVASTRGRLVNIVSEARSRRVIPSTTLKAMTGEDLLTFNVKYKDPVSFKQTAKHVFAANEMIRFDDDTEAINRRLVALPFNRTFAPSERDRNLVTKLEKELPGILNWAMRAHADLETLHAFPQPPESLALKEDFSLTQNPVLAFVEGFCELIPGERVRRTAVYQSYCGWHRYANMPGRPLRDRDFYAKLRSAYPQLSFLHSSDNFIEGIGLLSVPDPAQGQVDDFIAKMRPRISTKSKKH
ncbi:MAG: phage/plasmid primase, P4 family [Planctomycetota bacterium]